MTCEQNFNARMHRLYAAVIFLSRARNKLTAYPSSDAQYQSGYLRQFRELREQQRPLALSLLALALARNSGHN